MPDSFPTLSVAPTGGNSQQSYDEVPYESHPFSQTHPSRMFTIATLFGMRPAPVQRCRVLELGCSTGGNLLPMADYLPDSEFVGVDYSSKQIGIAQEMTANLGLKNVIFKHASILDVDAAYGTFDYIIVHGVYSWVPANVQAKIMDICSELLNPNGVAYISYNTFPGWHMRAMVRDMMRYHASRFTTPKDRIQQARALLDFLAREVKQEGPYQMLLRAEVESLRTQADYYLYHEHLEEENSPIYFHEFAERASKKRLRYLGEARIATMVTGNFGADVEKTLRMLATDNIQAEQYMDFLRNRMFRESLLVHERIQPNWSIAPDSVKALHIASPARLTLPEGVVEPDMLGTTELTYRGPSGMTVNTQAPLLKATMAIMHNAFPATVPFDLLRRQAREMIGGDANDATKAAEDTKMIAVGLLNCYMSSDVIEFHGMPVSFTKTVSANPIAMPIARLMTTRTGQMPNRRHEVVRLDELDTQLVPLLDGTHDRTMLLDKMTELGVKGVITVNRDGNPLTDKTEVRQALDSILDRRLANLARMAILIG